MITACAKRQGTGLGTQLQNVMMDYAKRKGIRGFFADILLENMKMKKLAQSLPNASIKNLGDVLEVTCCSEGQG